MVLVVISGAIEPGKLHSARGKIKPARAYATTKSKIFPFPAFSCFGSSYGNA